MISCEQKKLVILTTVAASGLDDGTIAPPTSIKEKGKQHLMKVYEFFNLVY